jgi:hypothetical protein
MVVMIGAHPMAMMVVQGLGGCSASDSHAEHEAD